MKRLLLLASAGYLLGGCALSKQPQPVDGSDLNIIADTANHVVCYTVRGYSYPSCLQVAPKAEPDGTFHVPRNPGSAYSHERINRV